MSSSGFDTDLSNQVLSDSGFTLMYLGFQVQMYKIAKRVIYFFYFFHTPSVRFDNLR